MSPVLLHCDSELDTAVFENDHEPVSVNWVHIATVHVKTASGVPAFLAPLYSRRKRAIELSAVRSNFYFVTNALRYRPFLQGVSIFDQFKWKRGRL